MKNRFFTIMIIPEKTTSVRKFILQRRQLKHLAIAVSIFGLLGITSLFLSYKYFSQLFAHRSMQERVVFLEDNLKELQNQLGATDSTLARIQNFEQKLRVITRLEDSSRNVAIGPLTEGDTLNSDSLTTRLNQFGGNSSDIPEEYRFEFKETSLKLSELDVKARLQEQTIHDLYELLQDQKSLLSHTPSIWPVKGWITSTFGYRTSPFTGRIQMHEGLDIATRMATPIVAPADGIVVRIHTLEGYGKTLVLDHGYGVISRYGHNSDILVGVGDHVKRGQVIAKVGNTGISTGPHLHYEVRLNGVPVDPRKYILD